MSSFGPSCMRDILPRTAVAKLSTETVTAYVYYTACLKEHLTVVF